jgi:hypothetical protein
VGHDRRIALLANWTHHADVGWVVRAQRFYSTRDPFRRHKFRVVVDAHQILGTVLVGVLHHLVEWYFVRGGLVETPVYGQPRRVLETFVMFLPKSIVVVDAQVQANVPALQPFRSDGALNGENQQGLQTGVCQRTPRLERTRAGTNREHWLLLHRL